MFKKMFVVFTIMFITFTAAKSVRVKTKGIGIGIVLYSTVMALTTPRRDSAEILELLLLAPSRNATK